MRILFAAPVTFEKATFFISQYTISLAKAAKQLGNDVKIVQTTENRFNPHLWSFISREYETFRKYLKKVADFPHDMLLKKQVLSEVEAFKPDYLFLYLDDTAHCVNIIPQIQSMGVKIFTWRGLSPHVTNPDILNFLKQMDYIFIYDPSYVPIYKALGFSNIHLVSMGCDVDYHDQIIPDDDFKASNDFDVVFVGIVDEYREKFLNALKGFKLGIWTWKLNNPFSKLKPYVQGVSHGEHMIKLYKSSKIIINIHREFEENGGNYRLFEIPACRSMQIVDEKKQISKYFAVDQEIVTFRSPEELASKVSYYLNHYSERQQIAERGYERVKKDHTLIIRMDQMINILRK